MNEKNNTKQIITILLNFLRCSFLTLKRGFGLSSSFIAFVDNYQMLNSFN